MQSTGGPWTKLWQRPSFIAGMIWRSFASSGLRNGRPHILQGVSENPLLNCRGLMDWGAALKMASAMAHSHAGQGLLPISLSFRDAKIVAAKSIAYFRSCF